MADMPKGRHELGDAPAPIAEAPAQHRDHLWVLAIIAVCVLIEVWASWIEIGSMSGFPRIGGAHGISTDWTLAVTTEAYWAYALYSWLAASPGPRSREFAKWSAAAVFCLSLVGQGAAHLVKPGTTPPAALVVFVSSLPVLVLALIAILIHLRQADREETAKGQRKAKAAAEAAAIERAEADERTWLRAELERVTTELAAVAEAAEARQAEARRVHGLTVSVLEDRVNAARAEAEAAARKAEALTRKLASATGAGKGGNGARKRLAVPAGSPSLYRRKR